MMRAIVLCIGVVSLFLCSCGPSSRGMEAIYYDQKGETLEFKSDGRVILANERIGRYTREGAKITATDNAGDMIWFIADIKKDLLVPQERSRMKDVYMIEKAYKEKLAEQEAAHKRFVEMIQESAKPDAPQSAAKELGIPVEKTLPKSGIVLRLIPAGVFIMGSPTNEERRVDAEVQHAVRISKPFYIGKYEVTQGQWQKVMGNNPAKFKDVGESGPVEQVSWNACQEFIRKLEELEGLPDGSMRLPTEAEWEYACRAGTQTAFCYGYDLDSSMANFDGNYPYGNGSKGEYRKRTVPVGSFNPNSWGLYDMHGNVWEWCQDWYGPYDTDDAVDPCGANSGSGRVVRGGGWDIRARSCRSAGRDYGVHPDYAGDGDGFRLCLPAGQ